MDSNRLVFILKFGLFEFVSSDSLRSASKFTSFGRLDEVFL